MICTSTACTHALARCAGCGLLTCEHTLDTRRECVHCEARRLRALPKRRTVRVEPEHTWGSVEREMR